MSTQKAAPPMNAEHLFEMETFIMANTRYVLHCVLISHLYEYIHIIYILFETAEKPKCSFVKFVWMKKSVASCVSVHRDAFMRECSSDNSHTQQNRTANHFEWCPVSCPLSMPKVWHLFRRIAASLSILPLTNRRAHLSCNSCAMAFALLNADLNYTIACNLFFSFHSVSDY